MATQLKPSADTSHPLESILARLRRRIRAYLWADGLAAIAVLLGAAFWISLALDWLFEPPRPLRVALLVLLAGGIVYVAHRYLVSRLIVRLRNRNLALILERRFGEFRDSLLTTVELSEEPAHAAEFNPQMLARAKHEAIERAGNVNLGDVLNARPLARRVSLAVALAAAIAVLAVAAPAALGTWARRSLLLSDELWPRRTHLTAEGFDEHGHVKIAKGSDWNLLAKADAAPGREIPEIVEVRYSTVDGARGRENMSREGVVAPGEAPHQLYEYTFKSVLAPLEFYLAGGDGRAGPFHLDVVDSPTIARMTLHCEYPAYTRRAPRDVPVSGLMQLPRGTVITIHAEANKPLVDVQIDDMVDENTPLTRHLSLAAEHGAPQKAFQYALERLDVDKTLIFTLHDADGIKSREPIRLALAAVPDEPPQVDVALQGIGTAVTPSARLPAAGTIADDYGVARVWFDFHVDETPAQERPFKAAPEGQDKLAVSDVMEIGDLELKPKQKLHWAVRAADSCALAGGPNIGKSQQYALDIVTPEQLRSMLEARELMLRRRFETIINELTETRDLLAAVDFKMAPPPKPETPPTEKTADAVQQTDPVKPADTATPAEGVSEEEAARSRASESVQVERVLQNSERSRHETLQLALAFDGIREEMVNNRVDTEELKKRLSEGVAEPLNRIAKERFPQLEEQLKQLIAQLSDPAAAPKTQAAAVAQIDAILVEMKQVLDKMLELETFNELLDVLRKIIDDQHEISDETKREQKKNLRDLIE